MSVPIYIGGKQFEMWESLEELSTIMGGQTVEGIKIYLKDQGENKSPIITEIPKTLTDLATVFGSVPNRVIVTKASDFGEIDSTKEYLIVGDVDMGAISITVPVGDINLRGLNSGISKLRSSADNYTMFISPEGGSGNVTGFNYTAEATGTNSKVYDIESETGDQYFNLSGVEYGNSTSLGSVDNYKQTLEPGGVMRVGSELETPLVSVGAFVALEATWIAENTKDFDELSNGQLRALGVNQKNYSIALNLEIRGTQNDEVTIRLRKWDNSESTNLIEYTQRRQISNLSDGTYVAIFNFYIDIEIDKDDYVFLEVANNTNTNNVTAVIDSCFVVHKR